MVDIRDLLFYVTATVVLIGLSPIAVSMLLLRSSLFRYFFLNDPTVLDTIIVTATVHAVMLGGLIEYYIRTANERKK